ncbi:HMG box-containing protein 1 isoform X1 [Callorhinchus milii]|uniref:HMG box-containing protein 1 isoform X1 n=2 Tax=Callorhinchus milii TaxID=7868 RepID=UPI001C3F9755|nr:HMG box-containing protein 1 isoform X1 [Callorhinchus milii]
MAAGLSTPVQWHNMVWDMKTKSTANRVQKIQLVVDKRVSGMDDSFELLKCNEDLPSSPGCANNDESMEYDDLPELKAVETDRTLPPAFHLSGVSHQQCLRPQPMCTSSSSNSALPLPGDSGMNWLTELANIATSPQSPLMQCTFYNRAPVHLLATSKSLHSYARPPPTPSASDSETGFSSAHWADQTTIKRERVSSESESDIFCFSSLSDDDELGWSHSWPSTAWNCFMKGTRLCFQKGENTAWQDVEEFAKFETSPGDERVLLQKRYGYGSEGLTLVSHEETVSFGRSVLKLTFDPGKSEVVRLFVECRLDHPFYVRNKGWCSFYPSLTAVQHGIPCCEMELGDVCLPPGHPDANNFDDSGVFDTFRSYDFTPLDSSAVYVLSSMARQRRASQTSGCPSSPDCDTADRTRDSVASRSPHLPCHSYNKSSKSLNSGTVSTTSPPSNKCKRPMNAFMLFAKKYRVEYTQMYPGKDNRAISVILGDRWKKMRNEERRVYTLEAKALAEEQKRLNPDCWKRKRSNSVREVFKIMKGFNRMDVNGLFPIVGESKLEA